VFLDSSSSEGEGEGERERERGREGERDHLAVERLKDNGIRVPLGFQIHSRGLTSSRNTTKVALCQTPAPHLSRSLLHLWQDGPTLEMVSGGEVVLNSMFASS
jgi:hypothetical protein